MEISFPKIEKRILEFWKKNRIFEKSIQQRKKAKVFVFYDGPITVNAKPGIHHVLARIYKDVIPRFKTMQGFKVERKNGWDTHGLPVELEVEKELGFKTKKDIEKYGIAKFNKACKKNVQKYIPFFRDLTEKIGYWVDMDNSYITYETDYIETIWWILKKIWQKGLLYEDYKVVPYCPRCGTSLSSHEVAQGYKNIKEPAIFIKFKVKAKNQKWQNTSILSWTTTPWTLPANVALAIDPKMDYIRVPDYGIPNHWLVLGFENLENLLSKGIFDKRYERERNVDIVKGSEMIGIEYEPLFKFSKPEKPAFRIISADFVSAKEGTGIVHIAPAFGEEDMDLIKMTNSKIQSPNERFPILLNVDEEGTFKPEVKQWAGMFVKDADPLIIEDLRKRNLLFKEELYGHDHPFCWRCHSPLLYYAKESWWIKMTALKDKLLENNQKINWIPAHLEEGRFGEWLKEIKDWAISRERYWGTPLPVWKCKECPSSRAELTTGLPRSELRSTSGCGNLEIIGSKQDLISQNFSKNKYYLLRHGQSLWQTKYKKITLGWPEKYYCPLTKKGVRKISKIAKKLRGKIDLIYSSDFLRTKQTSELVANETKAEIIFDKRLRDIDYGILINKKKEELNKFYPQLIEKFSKRIRGGENWADCKMRMFNFLKDIDKKYDGKRILIVSHGDPLWLLEEAIEGLSNEEIVQEKLKGEKVKTGELKEIEAKFLPYDEKGNLDFHRPFIDEVKFYCKHCGDLMEREKEVIDVWFDSGAMPFAQNHWPFRQKKKDKPPELFPADYISEAIDQTRGWFYTLLAISALLGFESPYKNVVCLGLILDEKGEKMSKSKGNVVDPWQMVQKYGADAVRWYFYTVNQPGDSKFFSEKEVEESLKRFLLTLWNCWVFLKTYGQQFLKPSKPQKSKNVLDRWILSKINSLILEVTQNLDNYDIVSGARNIENFAIEDLSQWYIRRSRKRFQRPEKKKEIEKAAKNLGFLLLTLNKLIAPFTPFISEEIYKNLREKKSVHLEDWPKVDKKLIDKKLEEKMVRARELVNLGLRERARLKIKIRQPLRELVVGKLAEGLDSELINLIKEELNIKSLRYDLKLKDAIQLDTEITPELKEEGQIREIIRQVQEMRKQTGLKPKDKISVQYLGGDKLNKILVKNKEFILKEAKAKDIKSVEKFEEILGLKKEIEVDQEKLWLGIKKL